MCVSRFLSHNKKEVNVIIAGMLISVALFGLKILGIASLITLVLIGLYLYIKTVIEIFIS